MGTVPTFEVKMKLEKIDSIMYKVSDLEKAEKFYAEVLGLKKVWEDKERKMIGFVFEKSNSEIVIHADPNLPNFDYSYLVEDVVAFCEEFKQQGYRVSLEPIEVRPGRYAVILDPDGNEIPIIDLTKFGGKPRYD